MQEKLPKLFKFCKKNICVYKKWDISTSAAHKCFNLLTHTFGYFLPRPANDKTSLIDLLS